MIRLFSTEAYKGYRWHTIGCGILRSDFCRWVWLKLGPVSVVLFRESRKPYYGFELHWLNGLICEKWI
jgi:hypothetical protein